MEVNIRNILEKLKTGEISYIEAKETINLFRKNVILVPSQIACDSFQKYFDIDVELRKPSEPLMIKNEAILTSHNLIDLILENHFPKVNAAAISVIPDQLFNTVPSFSQLKRPLLSHLYMTHFGMIAQLTMPIKQSDIFIKNNINKSIISSTLEIARALGAENISLQQTIPSATNYGKDLLSIAGKKRCMPIIGTGHQVTIASIVLMMERLLLETKRNLEQEILGIIGLGSIGLSTLELSLNVIGRPRKIYLCDLMEKESVLIEIKKSIRLKHNFDGDIQIIKANPKIPLKFYESTLILGASNFPNVLDIEKVQSGTLIIDDSAPHAYNPEIAFKRLNKDNDILFTEGGLIRSPIEINSIRNIPIKELNITQDQYQRIENYVYEKSPHEIMGCAFSSLLMNKFHDISPVIGLINSEHSLKAYKKLSSLNFTGADIRSFGRLLTTKHIAEFNKKYGGNSMPIKDKI